MGYTDMKFQLPSVWKKFANIDYDLCPSDPHTPAVDVRDPQPRVNDLRTLTFRLKKYDFVFSLVSDSNSMKYSVNFAVWKANSTDDHPLFGRMGANVDRLELELRDMMRQYPADQAPGLDDLMYDFSVVWTPEGDWEDFIGQKMKVGDYIIYAAAAGRSAILKYGRLTKLIFSGDSHGGLADFAVQAVTLDDWGTHTTVQKKGAPVTLTFTNRMVVVYGVPTKFRDPLDAAYYAAIAKEQARQ